MVNKFKGIIVTVAIWIGFSGAAQQNLAPQLIVRGGDMGFFYYGNETLSPVRVTGLQDS